MNLYRYETLHHNSWYMVIILILNLLISGCTALSNSNLKSVATLDISQTLATSTPIITRVITTSPTLPTATMLTISPTIPIQLSATPELIPTILPTLTPLPTISAEVATDLYYTLYKSNKDCQLPCWWGFEIGKTTMAEIEQFYTSMGASVICLLKR